MRFLVRQITLHGGSTAEHRDSEFVGDVLSIGRGTDQSVQLNGNEIDLEHARITKGSGNRFQLSSQAAGGVTVNDASVKSASLKLNDVVQIGPHTLTVGQPPYGFDFAITVEEGEVDETEEVPGSQYTTTLNQSRLNKRVWSWVMFFGIFIAFLAIPVAGLFNDDVKQILRSSPLPSDGVWDSGKLIPAHQIPEIVNDCSICHAKPFVKVENQQCLNCHKTTPNHVDTNVHHVAGLDGRLCESCHKEHGGVEAMLVSNKGLCSDCHAEIAASTEGQTSLKNVSDFSIQHPEFALNILTPKTADPATEWEVKRVDWSLDVKEQSNLKFPHSVHMDPKGIGSPTGDKVLTCGDCHAPDLDGRLIKPVTMEQHCRSCHMLTFDEQAPDRQVPHGNSDEVMQTLQEYYSRQFLTDALEKEDTGEDTTTTRKRRKPGSPMRNADRLKLLETADVKAREVGRVIFEKTNCIECHEISFKNETESGSSWQVHPVKLTRQWFSKSVFSHASHRTSECSSCHMAEQSEKSSDMLIPGIENCRECHADTHEGGKLATTCISCHNFHIPNREVMK